MQYKNTSPDMPKPGNIGSMASVTSAPRDGSKSTNEPMKGKAGGKKATTNSPKKY